MHFAYIPVTQSASHNEKTHKFIHTHTVSNKKRNWGTEEALSWAKYINKTQSLIKYRDNTWLILNKNLGPPARTSPPSNHSKHNTTHFNTDDDTGPTICTRSRIPEKVKSESQGIPAPGTPSEPVPPQYDPECPEQTSCCNRTTLLVLIFPQRLLTDFTTSHVCIIMKKVIRPKLTLQLG